MKKILLLGAGRSATILIEYLLNVCEKKGWLLIVADANIKVAKQKVKRHAFGKTVSFDVHNKEQLNKLVIKSDLVISMLPTGFHNMVVEPCMSNGCNLLTASYLTPEMKVLNKEAKKRGILILTECGLDPGIDHMSAMRVIDRIRDEGGKIVGFESFTGGLLAPDMIENPWQYKFTWNPRNVVLAGQGGVKFLQEGRYKYIPYHKLFRRTEIVHIPNYGYFEGYANRDSLKYREIYGLKNIRTMYRGTLRRPGFCKTWDVFLQLGATDDTYEMESVKYMTHRQFINSFLYYNRGDSIELKLAHYLNLDIDSDEMHKLKWIGVFDNELVGLEKGTPAQILEHILKKKWTMSEDEADMIVMWHKFKYKLNSVLCEIHATLISIGENQEKTAMAKMVGLPLGIAAKLIVEGKISEKGVHIPIKKVFYNPILNELENKFGCEFIEEEIENPV